MKKSLLVISMLSALSTGVATANDLQKQITSTDQYSNIISSKVDAKNVFQIIVKFDSETVHNSLIQSPETNLMMVQRENKGDIQSMSGVANDDVMALSDRSFMSKYNLLNKTDSAEGIQTLNTIEADLDIKITHIRSLALGYDLIEVATDLEAKAIIDQLKANSAFKEVTPNRMNKIENFGSSVDFNDTHYADQPYFNSQGENIANGNFAKMKENAINNLGRNVRVGVIDSGSWVHDDMKEISSGIESGYDFLTNIKTGVTQLRSENHKDGVTVDGEVITVGHGIAVASTIAAISNNSEGTVGVADSDNLDLIYAKGCSEFGCPNEAVFDALVWLAGGSLVGVPDISAPVDVINMSLGGTNYGGCYGYVQEAINFAVNKGITVVVSAGNDFANAENKSPAACENVITVGATTRDLGGDKASFSNYGDKVDVVAVGHNVATAKLDDTHSAYQITSGTSFSAPIITGVVATLKLKYPSLTPAQMERILKQNAYKITSSTGNKDCELLGCGAGSVDGYDVIMSIDNLLTTNAGKVEHLYQNESAFYSAQMNKFKNVCNLNKVSIGSAGSQLDGVEYKVFTGSNNTLYTTTVDPIIVVDTVDTISYQACFDGTCGDINEIYATDVKKPSFCE